MKSMMLLMVAAVLCAGEVMAQGRRGGANAAAGKNDGAMITIREITGVGGDSDYTVVAPQVDEKFKKKVNHTDTYKKDNVKGWHYFEVAYQVKNGDPVAKKPILVLPEVEITYALLYDMKKSKIAASVAQNAKKAGGAIGWDDPKQLYSLITETFTYTSITPGREHYAAVCVPPSSVAVYGDPILFSVQIKVNGVQQGEIKTELAGGAKIDDKDLKGLVVENGKPSAWWERIENLTQSVVRREGILRDRSATPFVMAGDAFYDQVKTK